MNFFSFYCTTPARQTEACICSWLIKLTDTAALLQDDQQAFMLILHSGQSLYATKCDAQQPTKSLRLPQNNSSFTLVDSYVVKVPSWTAS